MADRDGTNLQHDGTAGGGDRIDRIPLTTRVWPLGLLLTAAMGAAPMVQASVTAASPMILEDLEAVPMILGAYTALMFGMAAFGPYLIRSRAVAPDDVTSLAVIFLLAALSLFVGAVAPGSTVFLVSAVVAGMSIAMSNPITNRMTVTRIPARHRGRVIGVKQSGVKVGQAMAGFVVVPMCLWVGWRLTLVGLGTACLLAGVGILLRGGRDTRSDGASATPPARWRSTPTFRWLCGYAFFMGSVQSCIGTYITLYAHQDVGFSVGQAGALAGLIATMGMVTRVVAGFQVHRITSLQLPLLVVAFSSAVGMVAVAWAPVVGGRLLLIGGAILGVSTAVWTVVVALATMRLVPEAAVGQATSLVYAGFYAGFVIVPPLFGLSIDRFDSYFPGWTLLLGCLMSSLAISVVIGTRARHAAAKPLEYQ